MTKLIAPVSQKDTRAAELEAEAFKMVPWFIAEFRGPRCSVSRGHWLEIRLGGEICYAQWEDVGPLSIDSASYVFGDERPPPNVIAPQKIEHMIKSKFAIWLACLANLVISLTCLAQKKPNIIVVTHGQVSDAFWSVVKNESNWPQETGSEVQYRAPEFQLGRDS